MKKKTKTKTTTKTKSKPYVIIRSYGAGVFAGIIKSRKAEVNGLNVVMSSCRRLWNWYGAASLSQMAIDGTSDSRNKFTVVTKDHEISNVIEIIPCTKNAMDKIEAVPVWEV